MFARCALLVSCFLFFVYCVSLLHISVAYLGRDRWAGLGRDRWPGLGRDRWPGLGGGALGDV